MEPSENGPNPLKPRAKTDIPLSLRQVFCHSDEKLTNTRTPVCSFVDGCWVVSGLGLKGDRRLFSGGVQAQVVPREL